MPQLFVVIHLFQELQHNINSLLGELSFFKHHLKPVSPHHLYLTL